MLWIMLIIRLVSPGIIEIERIGIYENRIDCEEARTSNTICIPYAAS